MNSLILITLLLLLSPDGSSQKLTAEGNQWNIAVFPTFSPNTTSYALRIQGDTLIEGRQYKKIQRSGDSLGLNWVEVLQFIREDTAARVFLKSGNAPEQLLYDFSLQAGDTFQVDGYCDLLVQAVDSVALNNGEKRKRLVLQRAGLPNWGTDHWIAGIGGRGAVLDPHGLLCLTDYAASLLCFYQNGELLFPEDPYSCFIVPVEEVAAAGSIWVFPNPFREYLWISAEAERITRIRILNLRGETIGSYQDMGKNQMLSLSNLQKGVYFIHIETEAGNRYLKKVLKY